MKAYRPDIDALRALSVSLVVIFHAFPKYLSGGFVGVDVFFVISGFLITKNIQGSLKDGSFSFLRFYQNRARRLLPALYLVIGISAIIGLFYLQPKSYHTFAESGTLSLVYLVNTFFARKTDYFGGDHADQPLLHLWSLSVEEQFYFLWPLMLLVLLRYSPRLMLHLVMFAVIVLSIVFGELHADSRSGSYFLLQYRVGELLLGAWLALLGLQANRNKPLINSLLMTAALILIIASAIILDEKSTFPGLNVLWPCLGAVLYLYSAQHSHKTLHKTITLKPIIMLGLLSYSVYLWHWPILIYGKASGLLTDPISYLFGFLVLILVSYLTWKYVEQAFRTKKHMKASTFFIKRLLPITLLLFLLVALPDRTDFQKTFWGSIWGEDAKKYYEFVSDKKRIIDTVCEEKDSRKAKQINDDLCKIGDANSEPSFLLIGDSHASHFIRFFDHIAQQSHQSGKAITKSACLPFIDTPVFNNGVIDKECISKTTLWYETHMKHEYEHVLLAAYWSGYLNNDPDNTFPAPPRTISNGEQAESDAVLFYQGLEKSIIRILESGAIPVLVEQIPEFNYPVKACVYDKIMTHTSPLACSVPKDINSSKHKAYLLAFDKLQEHYPKVLRVNINDLLCTDHTCSPFINGNFVYYNSSHLNFSGAKEIAIKLREKNPNAKVSVW